MQNGAVFFAEVLEMAEKMCYNNPKDENDV